MNITARHAGTLVEARGITVSRGGNVILASVDVTVGAGEIVTLIGPNGAGKTTVVRVMLGLLKPDRGSVWRRDGLAIGYMPQHIHIDSTLPLTVGRFLTLGAKCRRGEAEARAALDEVGAAAVMETPVQAASGGEFRRILLARALLRDPDMLVLDEPCQGIDVNGQAELYRLITRIRDRRRCDVLMVSHDLHLVMADTDKVVCLNHHVCCAGHPESVTNDPAYIALFGKQVASTIAVYHHEHDHDHAADGHVVPLGRGAVPDHDRGQAHDPQGEHNAHG
ncbi:MAG: ATP-binding cassette domain-containing protein [Rhodospirillales bacterium]|nr:ATP-binding cassette domain-containing protein [Rhodospirillales bacterium]